MARKSLKEEIRVVEYMSELAPRVFKVISDHLDSPKKADRRWATEQMSKLYAKAVPQKIGGDPDNRTPIPLLYAIRNNNGSTETLPPQ